MKVCGVVSYAQVATYWTRIGGILAHRVFATELFNRIFKHIRLRLCARKARTLVWNRYPSAECSWEEEKGWAVVAQSWL